MTILKIIHITTAMISVLGFFIRGIMRMKHSAYLKNKWIRVVPHINDTVLLLSAITLAVQHNWSPLNQPWLAAKIGGLVLYIALGFITLRFARSRTQIGLSWLLALFVFCYITVVAISKNPLIYS